MSDEKIERLEKVLLENMRAQAPQLRGLLDELNAWDSRMYEDVCFYRFYHQSVKVFELQEHTKQIVAALTKIAPEGQPFCRFFQAILGAGTGRSFKQEDNQHWVERAGPIVQVFLHARYFLEMAVKYGAKLEQPPQMLPSGWAALLELYGIR